MKLHSLILFLIAGLVAFSLTACGKKSIRDEASVTSPDVAMDEGDLFAVTPGPMGESDLAGGIAGDGEGAMGGRMGDVPPIPPPGMGVAAIQNVFFSFDSADLTSQSRAALADNAVIINREGGSYQIEGHCDERGSAEYNLALGERRARSVKDYLVSLGVDPSRLSTISYGEERPFAEGHNEEAWAQNRRGHFVAH